MAKKAQFSEDDAALLAELGVEVEAKKVADRTPLEERVIAGFEEIERFVETHARLPQHGEDKEIFERIYAVRLDKIRSTTECKELLASFDKSGLLSKAPGFSDKTLDEWDDDALLAELGVTHKTENDLTTLRHVKSRAEIRAQAEQIGQRKPCADFAQFKPLMAQVQQDLKAGVRVSVSYKQDTTISQGEFYIMGGQLAYIAHIGEWFQAAYGNKDARLRVIFDNGTEGNLLYRSMQKTLNTDLAGRKISPISLGPLFDEQEPISPQIDLPLNANSSTLFTGTVADGDVESGTIYVLRSKSDHPDITPHANVLHKIGVTGGKVATRITNAKLDPTFLMADVEIVASYELFNINRIKLERLLHRFFESARLDIQVQDRFGVAISPREWFLVPLHVIDEVVGKIKGGSLSQYQYDVSQACLVKHNG